MALFLSSLYHYLSTPSPILPVEVVLVVGDLGCHSPPSWPPLMSLGLRIQHWLHAPVKLAVGLLTVDDVESIELTLHHVGHLWNTHSHIFTHTHIFVGWCLATFWKLIAG